MKKVFWTSIVWIILFGGFALYMKWFNQPLAEKVGAFIAPSFNCPVLDCESDCGENVWECITSCDDCEGVQCDVQECECPACEEVEPAVCNCPAQIVAQENSDVCTKVFDQLDKIEKKISGTSIEKSIEEEFEEFKARRESKE